MNKKPTIIVLAAGSGIRFKGATHKLVQPFGNSTVLATTLRHAIESELPVVVVTTQALAGEALSVIASRDIVLMPPAGVAAPGRTGMGVSIRAGVAARADAHGWLLLPADMPLIRPATIAAVARALDDHPIAFAQYQGRRGHPVGFAAELYSELAQLEGDDGARRVLARFPSFGVEADDPGVLIDLDTEDDLAHARAIDSGAATHVVGGKTLR
jgi:molybdenum cofactor cytidylyltransferase